MNKIIYFFAICVNLFAIGCADRPLPDLVVEQSNGRVHVYVSDPVPVTKIALFEAIDKEGVPTKGTLIWSAETLSSDGQVLPLQSAQDSAASGGQRPFRLGLPASNCVPASSSACHPKKFWKYKEINTQDVLQEGVSYIVEASHRDVSETAQATFVHERRDDAFFPNWARTYRTNDYNVIGDRYVPWRFVERGDSNYVFAAMRNSLHPDRPLGYTVLDAQLDQGMLPLKPLTPEFFGVVSKDLTTQNVQGPISRPVFTHDDRPIVALWSNDSRFSGDMRLRVYVGKKPGSVSASSTSSLESEWNTIGQIDTVYRGYTISSPALVHGLVDGLSSDQNQNFPLVVTAMDRTTIYQEPDFQKVDVRYFSKNSGWKRLSTQGLSDSGSAPIMGLDMALTKSGTLFSCALYGSGTIRVMKYNHAQSRWDSVVSTGKGFPRGDSEHSRVCQLAVDGDEVAAVAYLYEPRYTLWVQRISADGKVTDATPDLSKITRRKAEWYIEGADQPNPARTARVHHVRIIGGDLYVAFDDFAGLFLLADFWPYSRSTHLVKHNGAEWVRVRSAEFPRIAEVQTRPGDAPQNDNTATIGAYITKTGESLLYSGARWVVPLDSQPEFQGIMTWELR